MKNQSTAVKAGLGVLAACILLVIAACKGPVEKPDAYVIGDYTSTIDFAARTIERQMDEGNITGLSVALIDDQRQGSVDPSLRLAVRYYPGHVG